MRPTEHREEGTIKHPSFLRTMTLYVDAKVCQSGEAAMFFHSSLASKYKRTIKEFFNYTSKNFLLYTKHDSSLEKPMF
jgi:hypothetical protein